MNLFDPTRPALLSAAGQFLAGQPGQAASTINGGILAARRTAPQQPNVAPVVPGAPPTMGGLTSGPAGLDAAQPAPQATAPTTGMDADQRRRDGLLSMASSFLNGGSSIGALSNISALAGMLRR